MSHMASVKRAPSSVMTSINGPSTWTTAIWIRMAIFRSARPAALALVFTACIVAANALDTYGGASGCVNQVQCLVDPCGGKYERIENGYQMKCVTNYCGGCKCDCYIKAGAICSDNYKCWPGTICALRKDQVSPLARYARTCIPPKDAHESFICKNKDEKCNPSKNNCCGNLKCKKLGRFGPYKCQAPGRPWYLY